MKFNNVVITEETIIKTRQHFIEIFESAIVSATNKEYHVNDIPNYIEWNKEKIEQTKIGKIDKTFTFQQRAYWIQTGEMVALFK